MNSTKINIVRYYSWTKIILSGIDFCSFVGMILDRTILGNSLS